MNESFFCEELTPDTIKEMDNLCSPIDCSDILEEADVASNYCFYTPARNMSLL